MHSSDSWFQQGFSIYIFNWFTLNWRIIALHYCDGFCYISIQISHRSKYIFDHRKEYLKTRRSGNIDNKLFPGKKKCGSSSGNDVFSFWRPHFPQMVHVSFGDSEKGYPWLWCYHWPVGTCSESAAKMDTKESFGIPIKENVWLNCKFCSAEKLRLLS